MIGITNQAIIDAYNKGYRVINNKVVYKGKEVKGSVSSKGYKVIGIRPLNRRDTVNIKVHRLLSYQKYGEAIFEEGMLIRHHNSNPLDNSYDNILIGTPRENMMDKPEHVRKITAGNANRLYDHKEIIDFYNHGNSYRDIMKKFSISSKGTVSFIIRQSLKSIGYI